MMKVGYLVLILLFRTLISGPGGGIGRRAGLKHLWVHPRIGSTPIPGTCLRKGRFFKRLF